MALLLAFSTISGVISTPITLPPPPTLLAARKQSNPAPEPRSRTVSPSFNDARATGLPHPRPKFAPSGTVFNSSSVYPMFLLMSCAKSVLPQHDFAAVQHELSCFAILAYPFRTTFL